MACSIIDSADRMDVHQVMALLKQTYWANQRLREQVQCSMEHSRCYGIRPEDGKLVDFARVSGPERQSHGQRLELLSLEVLARNEKTKEKLPWKPCLSC